MKSITDTLRRFGSNFALHAGLDKIRRLLANNRAIVSANDPIVAYQLGLSGITPLTQVESCDAISAIPNTLVINPGVYKIFNECFDCRTLGVYRFSKPQSRNFQRVVIDPNNPLDSALIISLIACRGNSDNSYPPRQLEIFATKRLLVLSCGPMANFTASLMRQSKIQCRAVFTHTLEPLNSYSNGHTLIEIWLPRMGKYVVVDLDKKCVFQKDGQHLNLFELTDTIYRGNQYDIVTVSHNSLIDWTGFIEPVSKFNYQFIEFEVYNRENGLKDYLRRICQVPIIVSDGRSYACAWDTDAKQRLRSINPEFVCLSRKDFCKKFYQ